MAVSVTIRGTPYHNTSNIQAQTMTDAGTPTANRLLLGVACNAGGATGPVSWSGYGLTWTAVGNFGWNTARNIAVWAAISNGADSTDPISNWASSTGRHMTVYEVDGVNLNAAILGGIVRDQGGGVYLGSATGTGLSATCTLIAALTGESRAFVAAEHVVNAVETNWESSLTELDDGSFNTPASDLATAWTATGFDTTPSTDTNTANDFSASVVWGIIGLELIAAASFPLSLANEGFQHALRR